MRLSIVKVFFVFCLLMTCGCSVNQESNLEITSYDVSNYLKQTDTDVELLRVDNRYIYINELDTFTNPFLFSTQSLIMLDYNGQLVKQLKPAREERVVDFVEYKDNIYYMYLLEENSKFYIEVCKVVDGKEVLLQKYGIDDPYAYPKFFYNNNNIYYKINQNVYSLETLDIILTDESNYFVEKQNNNEKLFYKVSDGQSVYTVYYLDDDKKVNTGFRWPLGSFIVENNVIYFDNLKDNYLYMFDLNTSEQKVLLQEEIFDFALVNEDLLCITTNDEQIIYYDLINNKILSRIDAESNDEISGFYKWIYKDDEGRTYFQKDKMIIKIEE